MTKCWLVCTSCGAVKPPYPPTRFCGCGGALEYQYDPEELRKAELPGVRSFWRYAPYMPEVRSVVTLGEGGTPLRRAGRISEELGVEVYLKDETVNPTGSFRDRCASLMVSNALDLGHSLVVSASDGNLSASVAAYSAKAGLSCTAVIPRGIDLGKLAQMIIYDAFVEEWGETVEEAIEKAREIVSETGAYNATAELNPLNIEALKTIAFEIHEQMGVPEWIIAPAGSGGTVYALWKGFKEMEIIGDLKSAPRLVAVQADGCKPIVDAYLRGLDKPTRAPRVGTDISALKVASPMYGEETLRAIRDSGGVAVAVSDEEILESGRELARLEGVFAEPASSATVACLKHLVRDGVVDRGESVVCLLTGSGLKTTDIIKALKVKRVRSYAGLPTKGAILRILSEGETYGYAIWKRLGRTVTLGAVYQHLTDLESKGLIASFQRGGRRYFRLTDKGLRALKALDELRELL